MRSDGCANDQSDGALFMRARKGDLASFDVLYRRHYGRMMNYSATLTGDRTLAEDITQVAFVRAYANIHRIRDGQALEAWLYRTIANLVKDQAKAAQRKPAWVFTELSDEGDGPVESALPIVGRSPANPADTVEAAARDRALREAIAALPLRDREAIVLHHLERLDLVRIGQILHVPVGTVKSRLGRARARLRDAMMPWFDFDSDAAP